MQAEIKAAVVLQAQELLHEKSKIQAADRAEFTVAQGILARADSIRHSETQSRLGEPVGQPHLERQMAAAAGADPDFQVAMGMPLEHLLLEEPAQLALEIMVAMATLVPMLQPEVGVVVSEDRAVEAEP